MDDNMKTIIHKRMERTAEALRKNQFDAHVVPDRDALFAKLGELLPPGTSCSEGGAQTLFEAGVIDYLEQGDFDYLDRYAEDADVEQVFHNAMNCQVYLMSSNAVTEQGELYNMDGRGNRVAALAYGPKKVVVIAGYNKIVPDLDAARERNRKIAAPANCVRLEKVKNPCYHTGTCGDCRSETRICSHELICRFQMIANRITVLLVGEELGY